jgi:hypothetical protein
MSRWVGIIVVAVVAAWVLVGMAGWVVVGPGKLARCGLPPQSRGG